MQELIEQKYIIIEKMLIEQNLQSFLGNESTPLKQKQRERKLQICSVFLIITCFQIAAVMFTIGAGSQNQIFKPIGFSFLIVACLVSFGVIMKMQKKIQDIDSEQYEMRTISILTYLSIIVFFVMCLVNSLGGDYHFILCGTNTFMIITPIFFTLFRHKTFKFAVRSLTIPQCSFWYFYYFLNVTWSRNIHWGFTIYFGIMALLFTAIAAILQSDLGFSHRSMVLWYFVFISYCFVTAAIILNWNQNPPWVYLSLMVHFMYIISMGSCVYSWRKGCLPEGLIKLCCMSENILKQVDGQRQRDSQLQGIVHSCRICLSDNSQYGFKCGDGFYHISICKGCVLSYSDRFKGNCLICGTEHREIYFFEKWKEYWVGTSKFYLQIGH